MATASPASEPTPLVRRLWRYGRALLAPVLIWVTLLTMLWQPVRDWLRSEEIYDVAALQEWLEEARNADATLGDLVEGYDKRARNYLKLRADREGRQERDPTLAELTARERMVVKREEINQHLRALGEPATKMYPGQLPLFPLIYQMEVHFDGIPSPEVPGGNDVGPMPADPVVWDSGLDTRSGQCRREVFPLRDTARVIVSYQLRAWNKRQRDEQLKARRLWQLGLLAVAATGLSVAWLMLLGADEREHHRQRLLARERIDHAERELLEQRLATQAAEQKTLELKSHLYASIGIMAGSYAHNIKNLLVRPNDLLRRCLEAPGVSGEQERMLHEVQETLRLVTDRLQQILHTVRRDPSRSELKRLDLNAVVRGLGGTWGELAADRWQLDLRLEPAAGELWVAADESHLHQAIENLLFNARDATFEMRNLQREDARHNGKLDAPARRQALIAAASWRGRVTVRTRAAGGAAVLEVEDNGAGMTDEVKRRCTETHFSTKRDNALYEGNSTGMGLGLSFVAAILENHQARLEIDSTPRGGTTFRVVFPAAGAKETTRVVHDGNAV